MVNNTANNNLQGGMYSMGSSNPFTNAAEQTAQANLTGAQAATAANRVNQNTAYGSLNYTQSGTDQFGNPTYTANQTLAPGFQDSLTNLQGRVNQASQTNVDPSQFMAGGMSNQNMGMEGWDRATGLMMNRLSPQMDRQQKALDTQLANQGIMRGSEAYAQAQQDLGMRQNDLLNQATLAGQQVQQNLFGQDYQSQGLSNLAAGQNYNQAMSSAKLPFDQLNAFRTGTAPNYVNPYTQAAVAGPDYMGAYTSSEASRIAEMNADAAQKAALTGGLYQMGSSALANPQGIKDIYKAGKDIYDTIFKP